MNQLNIRLNQSEVFVLQEILENASDLIFLMCNGDKNKIMIFERIICDLEKFHIVGDYKSQEHMNESLYSDLIHEFGDTNQ